MNALAKQNEIATTEPQAGTVAVVTPMAMIAQAVANGAPIEVMERLLALQERYEANQAKKAFDAAMASVRAELPTIIKNRVVDFTSSKGRTHYRHEDLAGLTEQVSPILANHGLSFRWRTETPNGGPVIVTCILSHRDGHSEENTLSAGRDDSGNKNSIQQIGSTVTYLQRYTLKAALGVAASEDDDAGAVETGGVISDEQAEKLRALADEVGADVRKFCSYMKVDGLAAIKAKDFDRAVSALEGKRGKA